MAKKKPIPLPPTDEIRDAALAIVRNASEPLTSKQVATQMTLTPKVPESSLIPILEECVVSGLLNRFPPATKKGKSGYWDRDVAEFARTQIEIVLRKKGALPLAKLKTAAKRLTASEFDQAFQTLVSARKICQHPPVGSSKICKYGLEPPACEPYLKDVEKSLTKIVRPLLDVGVTAEVLSDAIGKLLVRARLPSGVSKLSAATPEDETDLLMLMRQIEPGADRGALVTSRELRRAAKFDKQKFDQTILKLARQGLLMLHRHDHAAGLDPLERDELVTDGAGNYYVGMALRRNVG